MKQINRISKKISMAFVFLCILGMFILPNQSRAETWAKSGVRFVRGSFGSLYNWTTRTSIKGDLLLEGSKKDPYRTIIDYTDKDKRKFSKNPVLDSTKGLLCLQHRTKSISAAKHAIRKNIRIDGKTKIINIDTGVSTSTDRVAALVGYLLTSTSETAGTDERRDNGTQGALWQASEEYYGAFVGSESLDDEFYSKIEDAEGGVGKWANMKVALNKYEEATDFSNMNIVKTAFTNAKYTTWKTSGNYYIIGPFKATFTDHKVGGIRFAGESSTAPGETGSTFGNTKVIFCDANGNEKSPLKSGSNFYIKVPKSAYKPGAQLVLRTRRLNVKAEWWDIRYNTQSQDHMYVGFAYREYIKESATINITPPSLKIIKRDADSGQGLAGMKFQIKNSKGQYLTSAPSNGIAQFGEAKEPITFTSGTGGEIKIPAIETGTYQIIETSVGNNWQYEVPANNVTTVTIGSTDKTQVIENRKVYMNLSGYVWEDIEWEDKGQFQANGLYNVGGRDTKDKLLANVTVKLMQNGNPIDFYDLQGNKLKEVKTDSNGKYLMHKVRIDDLSKNYIEFTYNGMSFGSVKPDINNEEKGSKAAEGSNRTEFNSKYATIVPNQALGENGQKSYDISYHQGNYRSDLNFGPGALYGYSGQEVPINGTYEQYLIKANTKNAYNNGCLDKIKTPAQIRKEGIDEIKNINLGLERREQPDLSTIKDIHYASVHINGATHIYNYSDRFKNEYYGEEESNGHSMEPKVKFDTGSKYGSVSYTRPLYPSDVYYYKDEETDPNKEKQLRVQVTYKIAIFNGANGRNDKKITSIVNELEDYYDTKYEIDKTKINIGKNFNAKTGEITEKLDSDIVDATGTNNYFKLKIKNMNMAIEQGQEKYVYVQLEVQQSKIHEIVEYNEGKSEDQMVKLDNVVEITSYSTKDLNGNTYAGIDKDSQPGNLKIENKTTYEDDTDKAPGLKLVLQEERETGGIVFMDEPEENNFNADVVNTGKVRQGNGKYDQGEKTIDGVKVQMINLSTGEIAQIYNKDTHGWEKAETETKDGGQYHFEGFIPEKYKIVYTWGGDHKVGEETQKIRVQDYKATIYNDKGRKESEEWYKKDEDIRNSDAMDDYALRQNIDKQTNLITNANKQIIENYEGTLKVEDETQEIIKQMNSITPDFRVFIEYSDASSSDGKEPHKVILKNIDFGIIERAKQALMLQKEIKRVTIKLSNGNVLIDAEVGEDTNGKKKLINDVKHTIYMPKSEIKDGITKTTLSTGQLKVEMDNEILQGSRLEIQYNFKVNNISELDYINSEYYHYGDKQGYRINNDELVKLKADTVIDYLDNKVSNNAEEGGTNNWIAYDNDEKAKLIENGLLSNKLDTKIKTTNTIMYTEKLAEDLQPIGNTTAEIAMTTYKILPSILQDEDSTTENDAEIIQITKNGGSTLTATPGNYEPSEGVKEVDEAESEEVVIVPPTGLTTDYIAYTLLAISSLGILVAGIILIKKFVMSR